MNSSRPSEDLDFANGVPLEQLRDGEMVSGKVGDEAAVLVRRGGEFFAIGSSCTHYGGPLAEGLIAGEEVRCPLHHACFSLRTGEALRAPALDAIPCWRVEVAGGRAFVREKIAAPRRNPVPEGKPHEGRLPASVVIVGGGGAGLAAADMLRREGYQGRVTMLSADRFAPYDRPNASKDYLAGNAPEEYMPLRQPAYYQEQRIELKLGARVSRIHAAQKRVEVEGGSSYDFGVLLLATGADPVKLAIPGAAESQLHYLRTYADSRALIEKAGSARRAVVVGASFIGLEVAASLRTRGLAVNIVAPEQQPLERVLGPEIGKFIRGLHENQGVVFHLGQTVARVDGTRVTLSNGETLEADLLVVGVGVRPSLKLAEEAGLAVDRGVVVNQYLETSSPGIFAAGDIARWPDPRTGELIRVEHWVVAERQGQVAAQNMLGRGRRYDAVPFFWTEQYGVSIKYVGHAEKWASTEIEGDLGGKDAAKDCAIRYKSAGKTLAVATISRDLENLRAEVAMEAE